MYISYSGLKTYLDCPRDYWHSYINKTPSPKPDNRVGMLYGDTVGKLFESFYNDRLWRGDANGELLRKAEPTLKHVYSSEKKKGGIFNWKDPMLKRGPFSIEEVLTDVVSTIPRGLATIREHRLVGITDEAEAKLDVTVEGHRLGGRSDFIIRRLRPHRDLVIIDGKGSTWRGKYVNERQLRWYALLHKLQRGTIPDRLGFLYWRCEPDNSVDWFETTAKELDELQTLAMNTISEIEASVHELKKIRIDNNNPGMVFRASPGSNCKLCRYKPLCPEGLAAEEIKVDFGVGDDVGL